MNKLVLSTYPWWWADIKPLVTGSSRGIGAAIAVRLASLGSNVVINYISSASAAETVAQEARGHGVEVLAIQADVTKGEDVIRLFESAKSKLGRLDIVMSNSGIEHFDDLDKVKEEDIDRVLAVNVKAQLLVAQQSYEHMEDNGRLLLMSSISSVMVSWLTQTTAVCWLADVI